MKNLFVKQNSIKKSDWFAPIGFYNYKLEIALSLAMTTSELLHRKHQQQLP